LYNGRFSWFKSEIIVPNRVLLTLAFAIVALMAGFGAIADPPPAALQRPIGDLKPVATIHLSKTADWVAVGPDAVWVGGTGPFAVHKLDPRRNVEIATVALPGEPCAGLAIGFGALWVPLCGKAPVLARVDLKTNAVTLLPIGPAGPEGGIAASSDSLWMVTDKDGSLARIDPETGLARQTVKLPAGSYNPHVSDGVVWVTSIDANLVTAVEAQTGKVLASVATGPKPRFLTAGGGAIWTLNQGDGTLTRIDAQRKKPAASIALGTPGHGGDIAYAAGKVWTTMSGKPLTETDARSGRVLRQWVGAGGDSLGIGFGSIWLTDYDHGDVSRIPLKRALKR
jgi:virginiamycin B lyase